MKLKSVEEKRMIFPRFQIKSFARGLSGSFRPLREKSAFSFTVAIQCQSTLENLIFLDCALLSQAHHGVPPHGSKDRKPEVTE